MASDNKSGMQKYEGGPHDQIDTGKGDREKNKESQ